METTIRQTVHLQHFKERRRELREPMHKRVIISNLAQLKFPFQGRIVDHSTSGLKLELAKPLSAGASLAIEWDDTCILGDVAYCVQNNLKYMAGVKTNYVILDRTGFHREEDAAARRIFV